MNSSNRTPLKKAVHERVVEPVDRARLHPDSGIAHLSQNRFKYSTGTTNSVASNFWTGLVSFFPHLVEQFFHTDGLKQDEIIVDIIARTPQGNGLIPNVRLNVNNFDHKNDNLQKKLKEGHGLQVKIIYDGGRITECTPVSWVFDFPNAEKIAGENAQNQNPSSNSGGGWGPSIIPYFGPTADDPNEKPLTALSNAQGGKNAFITDHPVMKHYSSIINQAAGAYGCDANLVAAQIMAESSGDPKATSRTAAQGLMQLEPGTYREMFRSVRAKFPGFPLIDDPHNITTNILCGTAYIAKLLSQFNNDNKAAIAAYNAGPNAPVVGGIPGGGYAETRGYVSTVLGYWTQFHNRSLELAKTRISQRPEAAKTDQTHSTANTAHATVGGGTV